MHNVTIAKIKARCAALNQSHSILNDAQSVIMAWVATLNGKQIFKADGGLLKKFADTKPRINQVSIETGTYSILARVACKRFLSRFSAMRSSSILSCVGGLTTTRHQIKGYYCRFATSFRRTLIRSSLDALTMLRVRGFRMFTFTRMAISNISWNHSMRAAFPGVRTRSSRQ